MEWKLLRGESGSSRGIRARMLVHTKYSIFMKFPRLELESEGNPRETVQAKKQSSFFLSLSQ